MATMSTSRFVPRARTRLDWSGDPLNRFRGNTTAPLARAGLDYNRRLYSPGSAEMRALAPAYTPPVGWQGPSRAIRPGFYTSQYGTASVSSVAPPAVVPETVPNYDNYGRGYLETFTDSSVNPTIPNPNLPLFTNTDTLNPGPPLGNATGVGAASAFPEDAYSVGAQAIPGSVTVPPETPENARQPSDNPLENLGRDTSVEAQSQRYYDRKFGRNSKDPIVKMQSRRIDGRAPNVSRPVNPVRFNNEVAGHSGWVPY